MGIKNKTKTGYGIAHVAVDRFQWLIQSENDREVIQLTDIHKKKVLKGDDRANKFHKKAC